MCDGCKKAKTIPIKVKDLKNGDEILVIHGATSFIMRVGLNDYAGGNERQITGSISQTFVLNEEREMNKVIRG